jgi:hypothetical protein
MLAFAVRECRTSRMQYADGRWHMAYGGGCLMHASNNALVHFFILFNNIEQIRILNKLCAYFSFF